MAGPGRVPQAKGRGCLSIGPPPPRPDSKAEVLSPAFGSSSPRMSAVMCVVRTEERMARREARLLCEPEAARRRRARLPALARRSIRRGARRHDHPAVSGTSAALVPETLRSAAASRSSSPRKDRRDARLPFERRGAHLESVSVWRRTHGDREACLARPSSPRSAFLMELGATTILLFRNLCGVGSGNSAVYSCIRIFIAADVGGDVRRSHRGASRLEGGLGPGCDRRCLLRCLAPSAWCCEVVVAQDRAAAPEVLRGRRRAAPFIVKPRPPSLTTRQSTLAASAP